MWSPISSKHENNLRRTPVVWWGHIWYVAILFGGPELVLVGWQEGVDVVKHDNTRHPIGVLLGTCLVSMQATATRGRCSFQGSVVRFWPYGVWRCHADKWHHVIAVGQSNGECYGCYADLSRFGYRWPVVTSTAHIILQTPWHSHNKMARPPERNNPSFILLYGEKHAVFHHVAANVIYSEPISISDDDFALSVTVLCRVCKLLFQESWVACPQSID